MDLMGILGGVVGIFTGILSSIINVGSGMDDFAASNHIKLSLVVFLLVLELIWSIIWMVVIRKGITMGLGLYFLGTFIIVLIGAVYIVSCLVYTSMGNSFWLFDQLPALK